jgi:cytidylate kinase
MNSRDSSLSLASALVQSHLESTGGPASPEGTPPRFTITISREVGALGTSVATEVGRRLNWPVYDRDILDKIAEEIHRSPAHLQSVDERPTNWLGECLSSVFDSHHVGSAAYLKHLSAVVRALAATGACVIVGRAANFILPAETTLRVRLVASPKDRAAVIAARLGLPSNEAANWIARTERERMVFAKRAFEKDPTDTHHYDLVLNTSRLSLDDSAEIISETLRRLERRDTPAKKADEGVRQASPALA